MIRLQRIRTETAVHSNFRGVKRVELNLSLLKKKRDGNLEPDSADKWSSGIWKEAKPQLLAESHNKCAYCETPTRVVDYGDVEHFRPKSRYWWLAYSYENYLASCAVCNQEYKKDFFEILSGNKPMKGPRIIASQTDKSLERMAPQLTVDPVNDHEGMPLAKLQNSMNAEYALAINPYFEDPSDYLAYLPILENKEVVVVPTQSRHRPVVEACESLFGINRQELMDLRFQWYCIYMTFRHTAEASNIPTPIRTMNENMVQSLVHDSSAYAGMIRYFQTKPLAALPWDFNIVVPGLTEEFEVAIFCVGGLECRRLREVCRFRCGKKSKRVG